MCRETHYHTRHHRISTEQLMDGLKISEIDTFFLGASYGGLVTLQEWTFPASHACCYRRGCLRVVQEAALNLPMVGA